MKYIIGYNQGGKFVIVYKSNNAKLAMLVYKRYTATYKEHIKIVKQDLTKSLTCDII